MMLTAIITVSTTLRATEAQNGRRWCCRVGLMAEMSSSEREPSNAYCASLSCLNAICGFDEFGDDDFKLLFGWPDTKQKYCLVGVIQLPMR